MRKLIPVLTALLIITSACGTAKVKKDRILSPGAVEIAITGDIMPGRELIDILREKGADYPFEEAAGELKGCQVVFGNLEAPLIYEGRQKDLIPNGKKQIYLYAMEAAADGLKNAGFNIVSLANNHMIDYGQEAVEQTLEILNKREIDFCGIKKGGAWSINSPCIMDAGGVKTGFLCYSDVSSRQSTPVKDKYGTIPAVPEVMKEDIGKARPKVDILIVYIHWGLEKRPVQELQYTNARALIDAGADAVIGSHAHIFQDVELYKGRYIFYGLGNFVFDMKYEPSKYSAVLRFSVKDKKISGASLTPVYLENYRPVVMEDPEKIRGFLSGIRLINLDIKDIYKEQ